ncbi:MAG: UPF0182 family protein, partial [Chloroflexota bacterium]|nr:UPF0182 family protein [Chloroflexota bacterium]
MDKRPDGNPQWGDIDWSNLDLSKLGRPRGRGTRPPSRVGIVVAAVVAAVFLLPLFFGPLIGFLTDLLWFRSVGFEDVYLRRYTAGFWAFVVFLLLFFALAAPNLYVALRAAVAPRAVVDPAKPRQSALATTLRLLPILLVPAFFFGLAGGSMWDDLLRWQNAVPFGQTDPIFGQDIGFYFFTLPVIEFVRGWLMTAVILIAVGAIAIYALRGVASVAALPGTAPVTVRGALSIARPARAHLSILGGLFLALVAAGYWLDRYDLLFRVDGVITGAAYTSVNARLLALSLLTGLVGIAALACIANAFARTLWVLGGSILLWIVAGILVGGVYPGIVETFVVRPDQLNRERPYLERNIAATREAYGLAGIEESLINVEDTPKREDAAQDLSDTQSIRLWDYRPLRDAYQQLQALRQYYHFNDVDVDRYTIGGVERPVMLSARELDPALLPREARIWQNLHLFYTHGQGAVLTNVGAVTPEGLPRLQLRDIPPQGEPRIEQPRIYYGELTKDYVIVGTTQDEFDYASERDVTTRFSGGGGVGIGGLWDRLLFAMRFADFNLLISGQIGSESRVLFNRQIDARVRLVAPFLRFDKDPYLVVSGGKLYWIQDAYTTGSRYPYSQHYFRSEINYIRNSVKIVTDAYDGSMTFYVVDDQDPVIRTLRNVYPSLFAKSVAEMPADLRAHLRYPEDLFRMQVEIFSTYHMTNPDEFYNRGDAWKIANEISQQGGPKQPIEPYYVTTRLPGSSQREFLLFVPMTPAGNDRDNMVAWIAGRADAAQYGKLRVLRFPKDRVIFGPLQIEARIEADATIRQQLTLLSSGAGANLTRGNLIVLPVGNSFLYIEPLFVQATQGRIPELKRVILATQDRVVMEDTFERALARFFDTPPSTPPVTGTQPPAATPQPGASPSP